MYCVFDGPQAHYTVIVQTGHEHSQTLLVLLIIGMVKTRRNTVQIPKLTLALHPK